MSKEATPEEKAIEEEWEQGECLDYEGVTPAPVKWDFVARFRSDVESDFKEFARNVLKRYKRILEESKTV